MMDYDDDGASLRNYSEKNLKVHLKASTRISLTTPRMRQQNHDLYVLILLKCRHWLSRLIPLR